MKIYCIYGLDYDSNVYVITGKNPTIIDCGTGLHSDHVTQEIKNIINFSLITQIVLTHEHFDHCGGAKKIRDLTKNHAKIFAHENASKKIEKGESEFAKMLGSEMPKINVDKKIKDGDKIIIGNENFEVLYTPGHTPGCICLYNQESKSLISGDTVFAYGGFGRYDFPGGNASQLKKSIERLSKLDVKNLYPGHESIIEGEAKRHLNKTFQNIQYID